MTRQFNLSRALTNWRMAYPNAFELECVLRHELESCHGTFKDHRGHVVSREYPETVKNLTLLLASLALDGNPGGDE